MDDETWYYCRGTAAETEEILDFANMVFSMEYGGTDFASLLPKAYSQGRCQLLTHHTIREGNRIRALVDSYPVTLRLNGGGNQGRTLAAAYVGTVSVHPNSRGKGYMTELMRHVGEDARRQGCALMILDGSRHRYQHYGFERAGIRYSFHVGMDNARHCCGRLYDKAYMEAPAYAFEEIDGQSPYLGFLYGLYQRRAVTARSLADFLPCLQSWHASAYAVLRGDVPAGYVNLSGDGRNLSEFEIDDCREIPRVVYDLMKGFDLEELGISVGMDETGKIEYLEGLCDYCNASMSHQVRIMDYGQVLGFLLDWKRKYDTLVISDYVVGVRSEETGITANYLLSVRKEGVRVSRTGKAADIVLGELELVRTLTTNFCFVGQHGGAHGNIKNAPAGWFPLPFYLPEADAF